MKLTYSDLNAVPPRLQHGDVGEKPYYVTIINRTPRDLDEVAIVFQRWRKPGRGGGLGVLARSNLFSQESHTFRLCARGRLHSYIVLAATEGSVVLSWPEPQNLAAKRFAALVAKAQAVHGEDRWEILPTSL